MSRGLFIFITRMVCLVCCAIGLYKGISLDAFLFVGLMFMVFWCVPVILAFIFFRNELNENPYDGEIMIKTESNGDTNYILRIYQIEDVVNRESIVIRVNDEIRALNTDSNEDV